MLRALLVSFVQAPALLCKSEEIQTSNLHLPCFATLGLCLTFMASDEEFDVNVELLEAARYGEVEEVQDLLSQGANVNFQDALGNSGD